MERVKYIPWQRDATTDKAKTLLWLTSNANIATSINVKELIMSNTFAKRLVLAVALVAAAGAQASVIGSRDPYSDGARSVQDAHDVFSEGARSVPDARDPFTEGARSVQDPRSPYFEGAHTIAGMDRVGVSALPARSADPYTDGAKTGKFDPYTDGTHMVAGLDRSGMSPSPARSAGPYTDGAVA
ncbi:copper resistance protein CopQ [Cupriavidus lacunae]